MTYGADMLDRIKSNKNKDGNEIILEQTRGTFTGSAIGLLVGLYIGHSRKYNLVMSAFVGASIAGLITRIFILKNKN